MKERQRLNRDSVLRAAVELVDEEGLDALTMRTLGRRLGIEAMSLYYHVPSKEALLDGLVEVVLADVGSDAEDWREALQEIARGYRKAARLHPEIVKLFAVRRFTTPPWARTTEDTLAAFRRGGFGAAESVHGYRIVSAYLTGYIFGELRLQGAPSLGDYLAQIDATGFPILHELAGELAGLDRDREYEFGLELILEALERQR